MSQPFPVPHVAPDVESGVGPGVEPEADRAEPLLSLRGVFRDYGEVGVRVLDDVDLDVDAGDYVTVVGDSGSGKSTLLHILGLLDRPTRGEYVVDGHPTSTLSESARAELRAGSIGFVFQAFHLLPHRTVLENVLLATLYSGVPRRERVARAMDALERVHLMHRVDFLPTRLSGGERQRVAVARAVVAGPRLLLADEPTGNLDRGNTATVLDLFDELHASGLTLMVITHDAGVAARGRRQVAIVDGRLREPA